MNTDPDISFDLVLSVWICWGASGDAVTGGNWWGHWTRRDKVRQVGALGRSSSGSSRSYSRSGLLVFIIAILLHTDTTRQWTRLDEVRQMGVRGSNGSSFIVSLSISDDSSIGIGIECIPLVLLTLDKTRQSKIGRYTTQCIP